MLLALSRLIPVPMFTKYRLTEGNHKMRCIWIQWRDRTLAAHHWLA